MFVVCCIILLAGSQLTTAEPCKTPSGQNGECKVISECPKLNGLLTDNITRQTGDFLRSHHCGFAGKKPKVCCPASLLANSASCGYSTESKIYGGERTALDEFPWMALLQYERRNGSKFFNCGGVIISRRYILTAAHCISSRLRSVRLGEYAISSQTDCVGDDCAPPAIDIPVEETTVHEDYDRDDSNQYNDIALIRLKKEVSYIDFIRPICLPSSEQELSKSYLAEQLSISGWGLTELNTTSDVKLKASVPVRELSYCENQYNKYNFNLALVDSQICAGGLEGTDSCRGDSGGPLMTFRKDNNKANQWYVVGVVSFGPSPCGMKNWGGVYTRVSKYITWIESKLKP